MLVTAAAALDARLLRWTSGEQNNDTFEELILDVFRFQHAHNAAYRRWCEREGTSAESVTDWHEIPAIPQSAFKAWTLTTFDVDAAVAVFHSSGTTQDIRSRHYLDTLELYEHALIQPFRECVLPDGADLDCIALVPDPSTAPHSSLAHMAGVVGKQCCSSIAYYVEDNTVHCPRLVDDLSKATAPLLLFTTAFALVHLLDYLQQQDTRLNLPTGSRVMETGGYKGQTREIPKGDLYAWASETLGVPETHIVNEYGMCELSSQWYETTLRDATRGDSRPQQPRTKAGPPWARVRIMDPRTMMEAADGDVGLIRIYDPMNRGSVSCIQTEDLGKRTGDGFEVLGRASDAELRGCSLTLDTFQ